MTPKTETPAVSVVIPAYNAAWCVRKAIDSVLAQDFRDFELIVVDDGSTDDTAAVLSAYGNAIRIVHQINGGLSNARNTGIRESRGEFVAFLDADDWWLPGKLGRQVELMRNRPDLGFSSTTARVEDPDGKLVNVWACAQWQGSFLVHLFGSNADVAGSGSAVVARRELFQRAGYFDESLRSLEDIDMWMRLAAVADTTRPSARRTTLRPTLGPYDGTQVRVENPASLPERGRIESISEPVVRARVVCPAEYIGNVQKLCHERRGVFKGMHYLDPKRVEMVYEMPLAEIVFDF